MKTLYIDALPADWQHSARAFIAMGDPNRQRILLMFDKGEWLTVGQIVSALTLSRPTVSYHLKLMREAGVLKSRREGKEILHAVDRDALLRAVTAVADYIREHV